MLTRIRIDNFKGLVDFELKDLGAINLFLGENGTGKSTVFEVLQFTQKIMTGGSLNYGTIPIHTSRRNSPNNLDATAPRDPQKVFDGLKQIYSYPYPQTIELDLHHNGNFYNYKLIFEQNLANHFEVIYEHLRLNDKDLLKLENGEATLYGESSQNPLKYPFKFTHSILSTLPLDNKSYSYLATFQKQFKQWMLFQPTPSIIDASSRRPESTLDPRAQNFVSWYRYVFHETEQRQAIREYLREVLPWFHDIKLVDKGEVEEFRVGLIHTEDFLYSFRELSDGQRMLIVLYTLLFATRDQDYLLCLDEPENYLALAEIQPWLMELEEHCETHGLQVMLISHHPKLINYLGGSHGYWFNHEEGQAVKARRLEEPDPAGISLSELIARGWLDDEIN